MAQRSAAEIPRLDGEQPDGAGGVGGAAALGGRLYHRLARAPRRHRPEAIVGAAVVGLVIGSRLLARSRRG